MTPDSAVRRQVEDIKRKEEWRRRVARTESIRKLTRAERKAMQKLVQVPPESRGGNPSCSPGDLTTAPQDGSIL